MTFGKTLGLLCLLVVGAQIAHGQERVAEAPPKYEMQLVRIIDSNPTEFVFVIGTLGFRSVDSLKKFLSTLPSQSTLEWAPGCLRHGDELLLSSTYELELFKTFCVDHNINFVLVPSG